MSTGHREGSQRHDEPETSRDSRDAIRIKVPDSDGQRMVIHVREGKGRVPRDVPLSPKLLELLRVYWRWRKPKGWLFPSARYPERPMDLSGVYAVCEGAAKRAKLHRRLTPHILRQASAYYTTFQSPLILKAIALGRAQSTAVYGRNGRLALVPARLAARGPFDR